MDLSPGRLMRSFATVAPDEQRRIIWNMTASDLLSHDAEFEGWAHKAQLPPQDEGWRTWLMLAGRGFGKTRAGAEWIEGLARSRPGVRIALVGATIDEARRVMVEGVSGILSIARRRRHRVRWEPSLGRLKWPNGSEAQLFSGDNPEGLRGPEHDFAWFLTFEIEADPSPVSVGEILSQASEGAIQSDEPALVAGYAAYGASMSDAVAPLVQTYGAALFDNGRVLSSPAMDAIVLAEGAMGCAAGSDQRPRSERTQVPARQLPGSLSLSYFDPAREYQAGLARASIETDHGSAERVELAAVLEAPAAKALAETSLARRWAGRDKLTLYLPPEQLALTPGSLIRPPGEADAWRAEKITVDSLTVVAELRPMFNAIDALPADPGRALPSEGVAPAPTTVELMELPDDGSGTAEAPVVALAASSTSWRTVPLQVDLGEEPFATFSVTRPAILGSAQTVLEAGQASLFDRANSLDVELVNPDDWLESRTDDELVDGSNLAMVGNEILQFGKAVPLGSGRFRLSRLLRGRFGSEWAMTAHEIAERFVLLDRTRLRQLELTSAQIGRRVRATAHGLADDESSSVEIIASGEALRPPSPVHLRASIDADGFLRCSWVRRSRQGWAWLDGVDAPLGCSRELYRVELRGPAGAIEIEANNTQAEFAPAALAAVGGGEVAISVAQVGDLAVSRPASRTITIT